MRNKLTLVFWLWAAAWAISSYWIGWLAAVPIALGLVLLYIEHQHRPAQPRPLLGVLYPPDDNDTPGGK